MIRLLINGIEIKFTSAGFTLGQSRLGIDVLGGSFGDKFAVDPILKQNLNGADRLEFIIPYDDGLYNEYVKLETRYELYDNEILFSSGRLIETETDCFNTKKLTFEGDLALLNDVMIAPFEFDGTEAQLFTKLMAEYNLRAVYPIQIGTITAQGHLSFSNSEYTSIWENMKKLSNYLMLHYVSGVRVLDFLENPAHMNSQTIEFGENIVDIERESDCDDIISVLWPFGAEVDGVRVDISSVHPTKYITSNANYWVEGVKYWDNITDPQELLETAQNYLNSVRFKESVIVKAIDLHNLDLSIEAFHLGDTIHVKSTPHGLDTYMLLSARDRNLADPSKDSITLGNQINSYTYNTMLNNDQLKDLIKQFDIKNLDGVIEKQTELLLSGKGGYFQMIFNSNNQPSGFYIMDDPSDTEARNVVLVNQNGFGFSTNGIEGPFFNAWTIDGHLNASAIYTGILSDKQGNFVLNMDTGEISVDQLTLNTPNLRFGDINNKYINMTNYLVNGDPEGVQLTGNGFIIMNSEGMIKFTNSVDGTERNWLELGSADGSLGDYIELHNTTGYLNIGGNGDVTLHAEDDIHLNANDKVEIEGNMYYTIGGNRYFLTLHESGGWTYLVGIAS